METFCIEQIKIEHNTFIKQIIKQVLEEHGVNRPGTAYYDECLNDMYAFYTGNKMIYFIALVNNVPVGGAGIYPTNGLPNGICELVKMYLHKDFRGLGIGKKLLEKSIQFAKANGFEKIYLETLPELKNALQLYAKYGFQVIDQPLGNSGHYACELQMLKTLV